jgi:hypothetical protein
MHVGLSPGAGIGRHASFVEHRSSRNPSPAPRSQPPAAGQRAAGSGRQGREWVVWLLIQRWSESGRPGSGGTRHSSNTAAPETRLESGSTVRLFCCTAMATWTSAASRYRGPATSLAEAGPRRSLWASPPRGVARPWRSGWACAPTDGALFAMRCGATSSSPDCSRSCSPRPGSQCCGRSGGARHRRQLRMPEMTDGGREPISRDSLALGNF